MNDPEGEAPASREPAAWWAPLRRMAGRAYRELRRLVERGLHPLRRRIARGRLVRLGPPREVMVVCFGNICRSPYAAAVLERMLQTESRTVTVTQAGFIGPDRRSPDTAQAAARARGVNLGGHRSRLLTTEGAQAATLVVVMEARQTSRVAEEFGVSLSRILMLGDLDPGPITGRDIRDPYGMSEEIFATTYSRIDRCVAALVGALPRPNSAAAEGTYST